MYLVKQAQNLVPGSETGSGWTQATSLYIIPSVERSPLGGCFKIVDSNASGFGSFQYTATTSATINDQYTFRHLFKSEANSSSTVIRIVLNTSPSEYCDLHFLPDRPALFKTFQTGSISLLRANVSEVMSPWFAAELSVRKDTTSAFIAIAQMFPGATASNSLGAYAAAGIGEILISALQITKEGVAGPYLATTTSAVSATPDYVDLGPSAFTNAHGAIARQHRSATGAMTRQIYGPFDMTKITDRFVSRADALKINCWWQNNVAVSIQNQDTGQVSSGFITNKSAPAKGFAEPYQDQYEVTIELEGF